MTQQVYAATHYGPPPGSLFGHASQGHQPHGQYGQQPQPGAALTPTNTSTTTTTTSAPAAQQSHPQVSETLSVKVPIYGGGGTVMTEYNGHLINVPIPGDAKAGEVIEVPVPEMYRMNKIPAFREGLGV